MGEHTPISVGILATENTSPSILFGLVDVLQTVGIGWELFVSGQPSKPKFDVKIVSIDGLTLECGNATVTPQCGISEAQDLDVAIVASFVSSGLVLREHDEAELAWLRRLKNKGTIIGAVCTGASLLAAAGILDNLPATSHWVFDDLFKASYPQVNWCIDKSLLCTGENNQFITTSGTTGWQELALYLIIKYCDVETANQTAKFWVMPDRGPSQSPYSVISKRMSHEDHIIRECQTWISDKYAEASPISAMTSHSGLPSATFSRRFKLATGQRPIDYVHALRIEKAKQLLEATEKIVDDVGQEVGYEDSASFRRIFKRKVSLTPSVYRKMFGHGRFERLT